MSETSNPSSLEFTSDFNATLRATWTTRSALWLCIPDAIARSYAYLENASRLCLDAFGAWGALFDPQALEVRYRRIAAEWLTLTLLYSFRTSTQVTKSQFP